MTTARIGIDAPVLERRAFPAASRLHAQVEEQARELHDLRRRLRTALAELGSLQPTLHAAPLGPQRKRHPSTPAVALDALPPEGEGWWPDASAPRAPLRPAPGRRCAGLLDDRAPVVVVSLCGRTADQTSLVLEQIIEQQIDRRSFLPLFLIDDATQLHLFRHQGYDVELLPALEALERCPGAINAIAFRQRRIEQIAVAWGVSRFIDMGTHALPARRSPVRPGATPPTLVFYKDYRRYNPYQHLLYASLPRIRAVAGDIEQAIEIAKAGPAFFHINWEEAVYRGAECLADASVAVSTFLARLDSFIGEGGRIVWTLHNNEPHDNPFPLAYSTIASGIAMRSSVVLVHSRAAAALAREKYGVDEARLCLVPHGGYHAIYGNGWSRKSARAELGLPDDRLVFGFVGNVRPYKNVPLLIDAFCRLPRGTASLLIAGQQQPPLDLSGIDPQARAEMVINDAMIDEMALPHNLVACDAVVLPFGRILTSGSLMLAMSLEVPVILPAVESLMEIVADGENGLLFEPGDADSLAERLAAFAQLADCDRRAMRSAAGQTARLCDWGWIGRRVGDRLQVLLTGG